MYQVVANIGGTDWLTSVATLLAVILGGVAIVGGQYLLTTIGQKSGQPFRHAETVTQMLLLAWKRDDWAEHQPSAEGTAAVLASG